MADDQELIMADDELLKRQLIRERAYQIRHEEGRPEGKEIEHWERAQKEIEDEDRSGNDVEPAIGPSPGP